MKKFNEIIFNKLTVVAEEAKSQGYELLSSSIKETLEPGFETKKQTYSYAELKDNVYSNLWKIAQQIMIYHDVTTIDVERVDETLHSLANKIVEAIEPELPIEHALGPLEPLVPGQKS